MSEIRSRLYFVASFLSVHFELRAERELVIRRNGGLSARRLVRCQLCNFLQILVSGASPSTGLQKFRPDLNVHFSSNNGSWFGLEP